MERLVLSMIDVKANGNKTLMQVFGEPSDVADELSHIVTHVTERIILLGKDKDDRKDLAETLAKGMAIAVKIAFDNVQEGKVQHERVDLD